MPYTFKKLISDLSKATNVTDLRSSKFNLVWDEGYYNKLKIMEDYNNPVFSTCTVLIESDDINTDHQIRKVLNENLDIKIKRYTSIASKTGPEYYRFSYEFCNTGKQEVLGYFNKLKENIDNTNGMKVIINCDGNDFGVIKMSDNGYFNIIMTKASRQVVKKAITEFFEEFDKFVWNCNIYYPNDKSKNLIVIEITRV